MNILHVKSMTLKEDGKEIEKDVFSSLSPQEESNLVSWKKLDQGSPDHRITGSPDHRITGSRIKDQGSRIQDPGSRIIIIPSVGMRLRV